MLRELPTTGATDLKMHQQDPQTSSEGCTVDFKKMAWSGLSSSLWFFTQQGHEISHKMFTLNHEESEPTKANGLPHAKKQQSAKHVVSPDETLPENFPAASAPGLQMLSVQP